MPWEVMVAGWLPHGRLPVIRIFPFQKTSCRRCAQPYSHRPHPVTIFLWLLHHLLVGDMKSPFRGALLRAQGLCWVRAYS